jgi:hypothetical protein
MTVVLKWDRPFNMSVKALGKTAAERPSGIGSQDRIPDMIFPFLIFQWFHQFKTAGQ